MSSRDHGEGVKVQFVPVGRQRRAWMWKARDESNTITISGQRFDSLSDAVRDARTQFLGISDDDDGALQGIALTATVGNGRWQYSLDGGTNYRDVGTVSEDSSLLLRSTDRVRYVPDGERSMER